ncbi:MAG: HAD-IIA family hydrolase [Methanomassiliicoccales archaeon]|uniref:HAD-IIA family hydrolase n=1 Tax=Candidatus Methanarcanum hacksteinii TaxID=2911857 RepID=UPI003758F7EE|nr:HAD-IIA family hydrolase [Methanomassiliicoccales archaeon]
MIKGLAIDMDGTVYKGMNVIPGADEFIKGLNERNIPYMFVTNNSSKGKRMYFEKLSKMGFDVDMRNVLTSGTAALRFLKDNRQGKTVYVVGTQSYMEDVKEYEIPLDDVNPDIVLLSFDRELTYEKINKAYAFIKKGAEYIATHPDDLCPTEDDYDVDIGAFIAMYRYLLNKEPLVIGKPNRLLLEMAAAEMGIEPEEVAMVGDRLYTDIRMAYDNGLQSILVLTGETKLEDLEHSDVKPTYVLDSVADIIETIFPDG